jgi:hypothetical protein
LEVLLDWYREWGVKINVAKSRIIHVQSKKAERCDLAYEVDGETIHMVSAYKYLGCIIDEHLNLREMVEDRANAGRRALGTCFHRCREEIGDMSVDIYRKLIGSLVDSTLVYGAEVWGCSRHLDAIEQVQTRALRMFFGVGTLHSKASLRYELKVLPLVWKAKMHCVRFWLEVLNAEKYNLRN